MHPQRAWQDEGWGPQGANIVTAVAVNSPPPLASTTEWNRMAVEEHIEKTHHNCNCRQCNPITQMMERIDAWKAAQSLLGSLTWDDDVKGPSPMEVGTLASWLYEGSEDE